MGIFYQANDSELKFAHVGIVLIYSDIHREGGDQETFKVGNRYGSLDGESSIKEVKEYLASAFKKFIKQNREYKDSVTRSIYIATPYRDDNTKVNIEYRVYYTDGYHLTIRALCQKRNSVEKFNRDEFEANGVELV